MGAVNDSFTAGQRICHKIFQSAPGQHNDLRALDGLDLPDRKGIVVQAGDAIRNQTGHGKAGIPA